MVSTDRVAVTQTTVHRIPESVLKLAMAAGSALSISAGSIDVRWAGILVVAASALLLFGPLDCWAAGSALWL